MKSINKIVLVVIALVSINSYSQNVIFDNQDNVRYFNNSWLQSWDLINDIPANSDISIKIDYDADYIVIKSLDYYLVGIEFINNLDDYDIDYSSDYSTIYITYYGLSEHIYNDDLFRFNVKFKKKKIKYICLDNWIIGREQKGKCIYKKKVVRYE